jgi:hypothetical protein
MISSSDCALCGRVDHFSHRVLTCEIMSDAITAAHNTAWSALYTKIISHFSDRWDKWYDEIVSKTTVPCESLTELKPDAILHNKDTKQIFVLEFKRTNDFFVDGLRRGYLKKTVRYAPLVTAMEESNPGYEVLLLIFCLGDRGLLDFQLWKSNWEALELPEASLKQFCSDAALLAQQVATDILLVYSGVLKSMGGAPAQNNST